MPGPVGIMLLALGQAPGLGTSSQQPLIQNVGEWLWAA